HPSLDTTEYWFQSRIFGGTVNKRLSRHRSRFTKEPEYDNNRRMIRKTGIIILAAGSSSRLGRPKQLLSFEGKSLLKRIADEASRDPNHHVLAVLGASHEIIADELADTGIAAVINSDWQDGMSGSIKIGLRSLLQSYPDLDQCVIAACDQPFIDANVFHGLKILAKETGKGIVTTGFDETWGIPVLFSKQYFDELLSLDGQEGAKRIVKKYGDNMAIFPFEKAK